MHLTPLKQSGGGQPDVGQKHVNIHVGFHGRSSVNSSNSGLPCRPGAENMHWLSASITGLTFRLVIVQNRGISRQNACSRWIKIRSTTISDISDSDFTDVRYHSIGTKTLATLLCQTADRNIHDFLKQSVCDSNHILSL